MPINHQIKSKKVRLIDETGKLIGIVDIDKALDMANQASLDLVEIASNSNPVVCKILNYGKYRYDKEKQKKINKKKQHIIHVKEIRFRPNVDNHELIIKLKITIMFRGREFARQESGYKLLMKIKDVLTNIANVDQEPNLQGKRLSLVLSPK